MVNSCNWQERSSQAPLGARTRQLSLSWGALLSLEKLKDCPWLQVRVALPVLAASHRGGWNLVRRKLFICSEWTVGRWAPRPAQAWVAELQFAGTGRGEIQEDEKLCQPRGQTRIVLEYTGSGGEITSYPAGRGRWRPRPATTWGGWPRWWGGGRLCRAGCRSSSAGAPASSADLLPARIARCPAAPFSTYIWTQVCVWRVVSRVYSPCRMLVSLGRSCY